MNTSMRSTNATGTVSWRSFRMTLFQAAEWKVDQGTHRGWQYVC